MPVLSTKDPGIRVFNANNQPTGAGPQARIPMFFFDTRGRGVPRFDDLITVRALELTHTVGIPMNTIKTQVTSTPWVIKPRDDEEEPSPTVQRAIDDATDFFENQINSNQEPLDHLLKKWFGDILSVDAGILELVPWEDGGKLAEIYARDGASFVKNPDQNGRLPAPGDVDKQGRPRPAYWQFPLTRRMHPFQGDRPLHEWGDAFKRIVGYGHQFHKPVPFTRNQLVWAEESPFSWRHYGMGRVQFAKRVIEIVLNQDIVNRRHFTHNQIPEGILSILDASEQELKRTREYWADEVEGQPHKLPIIGGQGEYTPFRADFRDLQFLESQEWYHKLIWFVFGLSSSEVGQVEDVNRAAAREMGAVIFRKTTKPLLELGASMINRQIMPFLEAYDDADGEIVWAWNYDHPDVVALEREEQKEDLAGGVRVVNEVRQDRGLDPKPWGDMPEELMRSISRSHPEWAMEAWDLVPEDQEPPEPTFGDPFTRTGSPDTSERAGFTDSYKTMLQNPERYLKESFRDEEHDGPALEPILEGLQRRVGKVFLDGGDDLIREVEEVMGAKDPAQGHDVERVVDRWSIRDQLAEEAVSGNAEAMDEAAEHDANRLAGRIEEELGEEGAEVVLEFDVRDTEAFEQMQREAASRMVTVEETVKDMIRDTIVDAFDTDEPVGVSQLTRALEDRFDELSLNHSRLVARTEIGDAARSGSQALAESHSLIEGKQWFATGGSTGDGRTRPWHAAMHEVIVPVEASFTVPSGWDGGPHHQPKDYPRESFKVGDDQPYHCRCDQRGVLRDDMPDDVTQLAALPDVKVLGVPPRLETAPGGRARELMRDRALPGEAFNAWVKREFEAAGSVAGMRRGLDEGMSYSTVYDWLERAGARDADT